MISVAGKFFPGAAEAGSAPDERWHMRKDGTRFWASGEMMPLTAEDGGLIGFLVAYGITAAATSLGGFIGPLGGSAVAATIDIRYVFLISGALMLAAGAWVIHAIRPDAAYAAGSGTARRPAPR